MRKLGSYIIPYLFLFMAFCPLELAASHIVGGEMNYTCLGNNNYEISLTIYRDCFNGVPGFDNPASIGIYDGTGVLYTSLNVTPIGNDTLSTDLADPCFVIPPNTCIHKTNYKQIVNLPLSLSGYKVVYQRCCRNSIIVNILNPSNTGATYFIDISPEAQANCNSSPVFKDLPNIYLCQGVPLNFDHSVIDVDGDSIVYELCHPYNGASTSAPAGHNPPPYSPIVWSGSYSVSTMLGVTDPLTIHPSTGIITGTPHNAGVFLVGVCAKEYRNGILLSTTIRDFQYAVGICQALAIAGFDDNFTPCEDLDYQFNNTSILNGGGYHWIIDTLGTSSDPNLNYPFPDTGVYNITLVAGAGSLCPDTFASSINVQIQAVDLSASPPVLVCTGDSVLIVATNSYDAFTGNTQYNWNPSAQILSGQGTDSVWVMVNGDLSVQVFAVNNFGCEDSSMTNIYSLNGAVTFDTLVLSCNTSLTIDFENPYSGNALLTDYFWDFDGLGSSTNVNPSFTFPDTGKYDIVLYVGATSTTCADTFFLHVDLQLEGLLISPLTIPTLCLGDSIWVSTSNLLAAYSGTTQYNWTPSNHILAGQGTDSILLLPQENMTLQITQTNSHGCEASATGFVNVLSFDASFDTLELFCNTSLTIPFVNTSFPLPDNSNYLWIFDSLGTSSQIHASFAFPDTGTYAIQLVAGHGSLCPDTFLLNYTIPLNGIDLQAPSNISICEGDSTWLKAVDLLHPNAQNIQYVWTSSNGQSLSNQAGDSILLNPLQSSTIKVLATNTFWCKDSFEMEVVVVSVDADFSVDSSDCNNSLTYRLLNTSSTNPINHIYQWYFDGLGFATGTHQFFTFPDTGFYNVSLVAGVGGGCPDTILKVIEVKLEGVLIQPIPDVDICLGDSVHLLAIDSFAGYSNTIQWTWNASTPILSGQGSAQIAMLPNDSALVQVIGLNDYGCADTLLTHINVRIVEAAFDSIQLDCGLSLTIPFQNQSTVRDTATHYLWQFDTLATSTATNPIFSFPDTGIYTIQLIADAGQACPDTSTQIIYVSQTGLTITGQDVHAFCASDTLPMQVLNLFESNSDYTSYDWQPSNLILSGQGTDSVEVILNGNTNFTIIATNSNGCKDTLDLSGTIQHSAPLLDITVAPDSIFLGQSAQLLATNAINYTYSWMPDTTLSNETIFDPFAKPRATQTYYLTVRDEWGCQSYDSIQVILRQAICDNPIVFVPSAFSPDGDGHNDVLMVNGNNIETLTFAIYNRWGQQVFVTEDQSIGWDGTYQGEALPPDVYGYYMQCSCAKGGTLLLKGSITLLR